MLVVGAGIHWLADAKASGFISGSTCLHEIAANNNSRMQEKIISCFFIINS